MNTKLFSGVIVATVLVTSFLSAPAEARRLFWWQQDQADSVEFYDGSGSADDGQDADVNAEFNQQQYDLYMREMNHRKRPKNLNAYYNYDPQVYQPAPRVLKKKVVQPKAIVKQASVAKPVVVKPVVKAPGTSQFASLNKRYEAPVQAKAIDCGKGASIVSGYGFSNISTKSCSGGTLIYAAMRSGKNFEIQVSAANGELTAVKKL